MSELEYEYTTEFLFPFEISPKKDFNKKYIVDDRCSFEVRDNNDRGCSFTLHAKCMAKNPENHDPTEYEYLTLELKYLYNILRLAITFMTGCMIQSKSSPKLGSDISEYYDLPLISHDFYEIAERHGISISPRKGREIFRMGAYICNQLSADKLDKLCSITQNVKREINCVKFEILDRYFMGFIDKVNPYYHWYQIVEILCNPIIGFAGPKDEYVKLGADKIDLQFLRLFSGTKRHSRFHIYAIEDFNKLKNDKIRAKYICDARSAKTYYDKNLSIAVEHYLLNC